MTVKLNWKPQRLVWVGMAISLIGVLGCLTILVVPLLVRRRWPPLTARWLTHRCSLRPRTGPLGSDRHRSSRRSSPSASRSEWRLSPSRGSGSWPGPRLRWRPWCPGPLARCSRRAGRAGHQPGHRPARAGVADHRPAGGRASPPTVASLTERTDVRRGPSHSAPGGDLPVTQRDGARRPQLHLERRRRVGIVPDGSSVLEPSHALVRSPLAQLSLAGNGAAPPTHRRTGRRTGCAAPAASHRPVSSP